jgi:hypothetical protein
MSFQFGSIKLPKLFPFLGIMTEPLAQLGTGRNVLQPSIETDEVFFTPRGHNLSTRKR